MAISVRSLIDELSQIPEKRHYGRVDGVLGLLMEIAGLEQVLSVGARCNVTARDGRSVAGEVIGFRQGRALMLPFGSVDGIGLGCKAELTGTEPVVRPTDAWLGRVVNALGEPLDGKGPIAMGRAAYFINKTIGQRVEAAL